jgi:hypothetical protein
MVSSLLGAFMAGYLVFPVTKAKFEKKVDHDAAETD